MSNPETKEFDCIEELMDTVREEWFLYDAGTEFSATIRQSYMDITIEKELDATLCGAKGKWPIKKIYCLNFKSYDEGTRIAGMLPDLLPGIRVYNGR